MEIAQPESRSAESTWVWIDRIVTELPAGPDLLELHPRLTVISSDDDELRRAAFEKVFRALRGNEGSHLEVRTEYGDRFAALRPKGQDPTLIDAEREEPVDPDKTGLGIVAQLNSPEAMAAHLRLFHVSNTALNSRVASDKDMLALAKTPIDQLWTLANNIQTDRETLNINRDRSTDVNAAAEERQSKEETVSERMAVESENARKFLAMFAGGGLVGLMGIGTFVFSNRLLGALFIFVAVVVAGSAQYFKQAVENPEDVDPDEETEFGVQIGRIDEMFDTHSLSRSEREAQQNLSRSLETWAELAGSVQPTVLIRERTRIEELASHLRMIDNEMVEGATGSDTDVLYGFASLLAELGRRFPAERVPLLVDDLFSTLNPGYHGVLRELLERASSRRQVVLESGDKSVATWAAAEAVAGNALLITDQVVPATSGAADIEHEEPAAG